MSIPDDVSQVIDKTVQYVLRNSAGFEDRLRGSGGKFGFLEPANEYHQYYRQKLAEAKGSREEPEDQGNEKYEHSPKKDGQEDPEPQEPRDLPFAVKLPTISVMDLEIIKLTALAVSQNGDPYIKALYDHQKKLQNEAQFEFLHKDHSLHELFQSYVRQYTILSQYNTSEATPESAALDSLLSNPSSVLERSLERAAYEKLHKAQLQSEKKDQQLKQYQYASVDWQDFSILQKLEFDSVDRVKELPVPLTIDSLIFRSLESRKAEPKLEIARAEPPKASEPENKPNAPKGMKIKAAGESRLKKSRASASTVKCPITGEMIPESKFDTHLKTLLRDPRYKEQQDNYIRKNFKYASNLTTDQVFDNIKRLTRKRQGLDEEPNKRIK